MPKMTHHIGVAGNSRNLAPDQSLPSTTQCCRHTSTYPAWLGLCTATSSFTILCCMQSIFLGCKIHSCQEAHGISLLK
jgi:hypothetical protein